MIGTFIFPVIFVRVL